MNYEQADWRMRRRRYRSGSNGVVLGGMIVAAGVLLLLNNMHLIHIRDVWEFWPLIMIAAGLARIFRSHAPSGVIWGLLVAGVGALILLDNLDIFVINFNYVWPIFLIGFGVTVLWRTFERRRGMDGAPVSNDQTLTLAAVFSGGKRKVVSQDFRSADVLAVFGGFEIDLRDAQIQADEAVIDVNAVFGGVEIRVPENWTVTLKGIGILGGFDDKTLPPRTDPNRKTQHLVVTGVSVFGGASVRN